MSSSLFLFASISLPLLWSYPVSVESDLRADALAVINRAVAATEAIITAAKSVETGGNKQIVETCVETSIYAIDNLGDCKELLKADDRSSIDTLITRGSAALADVVTCNSEFGWSEPPQVKAATKKAEVLIRQLLQIVSKL